jgi:putative DNA primase/helicase
MTFTEFAQSYGLIIDYIQPSDRVFRCGTESKPNSKNGAYKFDGTFGWISDWSNGGDVIYYNNPESTGFTPEQKREYAKNKYQQELKIQEQYQEAAKKSLQALKKAILSTHHYLNSKGLPDTLGLVDEGILLVPMRSLETNKLQGMQSIEWIDGGWTKKMYPGMKAKGSVLRLGNKQSKETFLVEGYATGLSVEMAVRRLCLDASVMVCFSDSNMVYVASMLKGDNIFVIADNDESKAGEKAAIKTGFPWIMSSNIGEDANDLMNNYGIMALCSLIMKIRKKT